jgi:proline iminopeptidase
MTPDAFTNQEILLDVGDGHTLYVHDWGNKKAKTPIVFLHGGPGSGCHDRYKERFDPKLQRVIFHDQRGCGRSTPYGSLEHNTTQDLVEDIEKLATKLRLTKFTLTGGSWGSALALMYALKYPKRITKLIVAGVFTGSQSEIDWLDQGYFRIFYPELWQDFIASVPASQQKDPTAYHAKRILGKNEANVISSAEVYANLSGSIMSLDSRPSPAASADENFDPISTKIETFYMQNKCFMPEDRYIMKNAHKLTMPTWIVQGRYDMVCPPVTAHELHQRIKGSKLIWTMASHGNDRSTYDVMRTLFLQEN